ncbi:hypothetical protein OBBRIDRAFT_733018, partial [Obba rivulosa]
KELVLRVVVAHLKEGLPASMAFEGDAYILDASRRRWSYGQEKVKFMWGEHVARAADDKWTFLFQRKRA